MNLDIKIEILVMRLLDKTILKRSLDVHLFDITLTLKISIYLIQSIKYTISLLTPSLQETDILTKQNYYRNHFNLPEEMRELFEDVFDIDM